MELSREVTDGVAIYRLGGRIDATAGPDLESSVGSAIAAGSPKVILDMRDVTYVSSAGLRVILSAARRATAAQGGLAVFGLQSAVNDVFELSGFHSIIPIVADEAEARSRLGG